MSLKKTTIEYYLFWMQAMNLGTDYIVFVLSCNSLQCENA